MAKKAAAATCILSVVMAAFLYQTQGQIGDGKLHLSPSGLALLLDVEGCKLTPYKCSADKWTWGIGSTNNVDPRRNLTNEEAAAILAKDVSFFERCIYNRLPDATTKVSQGWFDAGVISAFNFGCNAWANGSMPRLMDAGDKARSCGALLAYKFITLNKVKIDCSLPQNYRICGGVWLRRQKENRHCMSEVSPR